MSHHAILLIGDKESRESYLDSYFATHEVVVVGSPDIFFVTTSTFGVDDARALSIKGVEKAFGEKKFFIIRGEKYTAEAQNALLKTFEDPIPNTYFLVMAEDEMGFLPTLLSRMLVVRAGSNESESDDVSKFINSSYTKRLAYVQKFADKKNVGKYPSLAIFLDSLLLELREKKTDQKKLAQVLKLRGYAKDPAVLPRLILEHLALVL